MSTTGQNRTNSHPLNGRLPQLQDVQPLNDDMRKRYGFTGGPVFVTTAAAMQDPHLADALDWFNGPYESVTTGETRDIGHGFTAFFGFDPDAQNARAFYVTIAKAAN
ncbi:MULTISPECIES: hypothetical protein [Burkholderia]|uniref:hypothetical protein n=1 Tax=Burkholderia TaxID=32008 RepID=UPI00214FF5CC|nr:MULTISPECIES: hypothetical protein [Burkholderia]MDR5643249.1 hypothetical protein [Burkholderia cenocepacia]